MRELYVILSGCGLSDFPGRFLLSVLYDVFVSVRRPASFSDPGPLQALCEGLWTALLQSFPEADTPGGKCRRLYASGAFFNLLWLELPVHVLYDHFANRLHRSRKAASHVLWLVCDPNPRDTLRRLHKWHRTSPWLY